MAYKNDWGQMEYKTVRPRNGQDALDKSLEVPGKKRTRVSLSLGQFIVLKRTLEKLYYVTTIPEYHGYVSAWNELTSVMQRALKKKGLVVKAGKII